MGAAGMDVEGTVRAGRLRFKALAVRPGATGVAADQPGSGTPSG